MLQRHRGDFSAELTSVQSGAKFEATNRAR